jgi:hypothetical protein
MAAFVFASITVWYMFGEKFHKWQEEREKKDNFDDMSASLM